MSTNTTHFNFFKAEMSDPADITEFNANWDRIDTELASAGTRIVSATSEDGITYTATVPYLTELYNGLEIIIIPNMTSTVVNPTLNVNGFGAKNIRIPLSFNTSAMTSPKLPTFFGKGRAVKLMFDTEYVEDGIWKTVDKQRTSASDLYGVVPIESGGTGADNSDAARKNLGAISLKTKTATLTTTGWTNNLQTVSVEGVTPDNTVIVTHSPDSYDDYKNYCVRCYQQGNGTLTFKCDYTPSAQIVANVAILE